jgi:aspartyl-tRNA(Asn)/glutamyl-tRNA(Gln) amidotransferase subunit A
MSAQDLLNADLVEVADALARGDVSSEALTRQCLERLERIGRPLNAVIELDQSALDAAREADKRRATGERAGPLAGVPLAHKDLFYRAGKRCTCGSRIRDRAVADSTATVMQRLDAAGAVNLGSLALAEFALSPTGYNEFYGHGRNPWNPQHCSGGSSHGSGIAVAARLVYGSLGSDTGGSIRYPAAMCGITGLKPTFGRVPRTGVMPLAWSLDTVGPLARSARDCARLLRAIAGPDPADGHALDVPVPDYEAGLTGDIRGLRIAVPRRYYRELVTGEVEHALEESLAVLRARGAVVVTTDVPDMELLNCMMALVMSVEAATIHRSGLAERPGDYAEQVRARIEPGLYYPATRYAEALAMRSRLTREYLDAAMRDADLIHVPALPFAVPSIAATTDGSPQDVARAIASVTQCVRAVNYLGLPALSVPAGFTAGPLPVAFQLIGRPFDEGTLLRVADAFQRDTGWHRAMPPMEFDDR